MRAERNRPRLTSLVALDGTDEATLLSLAASLAGGLEPRIAGAIRESARESGARIGAAEGRREAGGSGVAATVDGRNVVLGPAAVFARLGISIEGFGDGPERLRRSGQQVLFVAIDGQATGLMGVTEVPAQRTMEMNAMEDQMRDGLPTTDRFPTEAGGLPQARTTETVELAGDRNLADRRFPVQWVIRPMATEHHDYRGYAGQVASGTWRAGDEVVVLPSGRRSRVAHVETADGPLVMRDDPCTFDTDESAIEPANALEATPAFCVPVATPPRPVAEEEDEPEPTPSASATLGPTDLTSRGATGDDMRGDTG